MNSQNIPAYSLLFDMEVGVVVAKSCGPKVKRRRGAVVAKPNK